MSSQAMAPSENAGTNNVIRLLNIGSSCTVRHGCPDVLQPPPPHGMTNNITITTQIERMVSGQPSERPPEWVLNLLFCSGWKVSYDPRLQDYVYTSPQGQLLHPFERVEEFLMYHFPRYIDDGRQHLASGTSEAGTSRTGSDRSIIVHNTLTTSGVEVVRAADSPGASTSTGCSNQKNVSLKSAADGSGSTTHGNSRRNRCALIVRRNSTNGNSTSAIPPLAMKHTILSWLINVGVLKENETIVCVTGDGNGHIYGQVTRRGILCQCCEVVMPLSVFERHASCEPRQPWERIYVAMTERTLLKCLQEAWDQEYANLYIEQQEKRVDEKDPSDDVCGICADGGHLICCDSCPSTFHQECLTLEDLPEGSWYCPYCRCMFCMEADYGTHGGSMIMDMSTCQQCKHKYHKSCSRPFRNREFHISSYCSDTCEKITTHLHDMIGVINCIEEGFSWILLKIQNSTENQSLVLECNIKLAIALDVLSNCFLPLKDRRTGIDMLRQAVYSQGSKFKRLNYEGFYTMILQKGEEIISAAVLRFHGTKLAEMPFVGTLPVYQRQGMCHRLLKAVDQALVLLQVEKLVIPAVPDLVETWKRSFSFSPLEPQHREEIKNLCLVVFAETTLLQKPICSPQSTAQQGYLLASEPKHAFAPICNDPVAQLTEEEAVVLEMESFCSFKALLNDDVIPRFCDSNLLGSYPAP